MLYSIFFSHFINYVNILHIYLYFYKARQHERSGFFFFIVTYFTLLVLLVYHLCFDVNMIYLFNLLSFSSYCYMYDFVLKICIYVYFY